MKTPQVIFARESLETEVARLLATSVGLPFIDLHHYKISPGILSKLSRSEAARLRCLPVICNSLRLVLVTDDPSRAVFLKTCPEFVGLWRPRFGVALTTPSALDATLSRRQALPR